MDLWPFWLMIPSMIASFCLPIHLRGYVVSLQLGYAVNAFADMLVCIRRNRRIEKRWKREYYVIQKIFEAQRDDAYKYQLAHTMDKSEWN